jgi:metal-responsive CopG/Arc/MetJ family transcriptional regulator
MARVSTIVSARVDPALVGEFDAVEPGKSRNDKIEQAMREYLAAHHSGQAREMKAAMAGAAE